MHRINKQLPNVQHLFAEAFIDLQNEIGEESARVLQSAANADDPLAMLLDSSAPSQRRSSFTSSTAFASRKRNKNERADSSSQRRTLTKPSQRKEREDIHTEGGFIREAALPEKFRKLQTPNNSLDIPHSNNKHTAIRNQYQMKAANRMQSNPYQRKQAPRVSVWNQVLDSNNQSKRNNNEATNNTTKNTTWEDMEKEMIQNITSSTSNNDNTSAFKCSSCKSTNIELSGNITSRNNDMMKGEVWGMKDREAVVQRCRCLNCGKIWNEE